MKRAGQPRSSERLEVEDRSSKGMGESNGSVWVLIGVVSIGAHAST